MTCCTQQRWTQLHFTCGFGIETPQTHHSVCLSMSQAFQILQDTPPGIVSGMGWWVEWDGAFRVLLVHHSCPGAPSPFERKENSNLYNCSHEFTTLFWGEEVRPREAVREALKTILVSLALKFFSVPSAWTRHLPERLQMTVEEYILGILWWQSFAKLGTCIVIIAFGERQILLNYPFPWVLKLNFGMMFW